VESIHTPRLFRIRHIKLFWWLKNVSITKTDILWYDFREYICCYLRDLCISSPLLLWPSLTSIMNQQICMTHDLATAYRHDHAWTDEWTQNTSMLSRQMSLARLRGERRQHGRTGRLYGTWGAWKNSSTCYALLNVGSIAILRRTHVYVLIWSCNPALPNSQTVIFQKRLELQNETHTKQQRSLFCCMFVLETMSVVLHGRSHTAHNATRILWMSWEEGYT